MSNISSIILKLAGRCNLNCSYCYVYNHEDRSFLTRPKFISDTTFDQVLNRINEYCTRRPGHSMHMTFHGGEPTLIGPQRFDRLVQRALKTLGQNLRSMSLQTNATLIDDRWIEVIQRHDIGVGCSLDGPPEIHDACRVDHQNRGSHERVVAGLQKLQEADLDPGVLCVVNPGHSGLETYRHFRSLGLRSINFLLPDATHESKERFYSNLGPTPVADYLLPIFDAWLEENDPDVKVSIFRDLLLAIYGGDGSTDAFGNPSMGYLVVETDGSIEALDALRVCREGIAKSGLKVANAGFDDLKEGLPLVHRAVHESIPLCSTCQGCSEVEICGGGYLPHRWSNANDFDNPSIWCADIQKMLAHMRQKAGVRNAA